MSEELSEIKRLKYCMYSLSAEKCENCVMYSYYDGGLCMVSGGYLEEQPSKECLEHRKDMML